MSSISPGVMPSTMWASFRHRVTNRAATHFPTPGALAHEIFPNIIQTPALDKIDEALVELANTPNGRLILSMPPQEGKSQRCSRAFPLWRLTQDPHLKIAIASYEFNIARRWGRMIRDDILANPRLGLRIKTDVSSQNEWEIEGSFGGVFTTGVGGAMTGRAVDLLIIDDPIKDAIQADSETYRERVWDWYQTVAQTRLAPGASVLVVMTRWHHDDLAGRLLHPEEDMDLGGYPWTFLNIPAQATSNDDPLGRVEGEWLVSARGRTPEDWAKRKADTQLRTWEAMYQGDPVPGDTQLFPPDKWQRWTGMPQLTPQSRYIMSWDMAFKDTKSSDFVVGQFWVQTGADCYLIDQVRGRMSFTNTLKAFLAFAKQWNMATVKLVEDKANGTAVIDSLRRTIPGLMPVNPRGGKEARAAAISPFQETGNIKIPAAARFPSGGLVQDFIDECAKFPVGNHDDQVDAMSQGVAYLLLPAEGIGGRLYNIG